MGRKEKKERRETDNRVREKVKRGGKEKRIIKVDGGRRAGEKNRRLRETERKREGRYEKRGSDLGEETKMEDMGKIMWKMAAL
ncbi:MAG: hypothetical protein V1696_03480 [Candidatus Jorgensenbacteria bacterium]